MQIENNTLQKLIEFLHFHETLPEDIWQGSTELTLPEFQKALQSSFAYTLTPEELSSLAKLNPSKILRPAHFAAFKIWPAKYVLCRQRRPETKINKPSQTSSYKENSHVDAVMGHKWKQLPRRSNFPINPSFFDLQQISKKPKDKIEDLRADMQTNVLEKKWATMVMASEMNKWAAQDLTAKERKEGVKGVMYKIANRQNQLSVTLCCPDRQVEVAESVFEKKYKTAQKNHLALQQELKKGKAEVESQTKRKGLAQREQDLNEVLLEVLRAKSIFQHQMKMMTDAAVNC